MSVTTASTTQLQGKRLGSFLVEGFLGRGGMGSVWRGQDTALQRPVAIKTLSSEIAADPLYVERFVREARTSARLNHPNVVQVYGAGAEDGVVFMALELVEGGSLAGLVERLRPFPVRRACELARDAARGLAAAHGMSIIHRDLKPDNILLTPDGVVKLADFGLARSLQSSQRITQSGTFLGTPQYASPEQCQGEEVGTESDLYSLGVVLYELLAGRPPHEAPTPLALFRKILEEPARPLGELRDEVPPQLAAVVARLLAKDPKARGAGAAAMADDLDRIIAALPDDPKGREAVRRALAESSVSPTSKTFHDQDSSSASPFAPSESGAPIVLPGSTASQADTRVHGTTAASPPKPPRRRGLVLAAVGAPLLAALAVAALVPGTEKRPAKVAVLDWIPKNAAAGDLAWLADAVPEFVQSSLTADVAAVQLVNVTETARLLRGRPLDERGAEARWADVVRAMQADYGVAGSFYDAGGKVVIISKLIDASGGVRHGWPTRTFDRDVVLDELAGVAGAIKDELGGRWIFERSKRSFADRLVAALPGGPAVARSAPEERARAKELDAADGLRAKAEANAPQGAAPSAKPSAPPPPAPPAPETLEKDEQPALEPSPPAQERQRNEEPGQRGRAGRVADQSGTDEEAERDKGAPAGGSSAGAIPATPPPPEPATPQPADGKADDRPARPHPEHPMLVELRECAGEDAFALAGLITRASQSDDPAVRQAALDACDKHGARHPRLRVLRRVVERRVAGN